jgi:16S rRNA (guanine1516-N2)-methyltransferase
MADAARVTRDTRVARASALARALDLHVADDGVSIPLGKAQLLVEDEGLALAVEGFRKPLRVDFAVGRLGYRFRHPGREQLVRACGLTRRRGLSVVDATAGLGVDSFVLASHGARVTLVERHPLVFALLSDALRRARESSGLQEVMSRMELVHAEASVWLAAAEPPDVIYLDPMFPPREKSALVKRPMRMLQAVVGNHDDAEALLRAAMGASPRRVVIKRPRRAGGASVEQPSSFSVEGRRVRFDVYELS